MEYLNIVEKNNNLISIKEKREKFNIDRYKIQYEHTLKDFKDVFEIEKDYLEGSTISSVEQVSNWDKKNKDIHIFVKDILRDKIVGEITILPLNYTQFNKFINMTLEDTELESDSLEKYIDNHEYYLLFSCIAISKEYRDNPVILYLLLIGLQEKTNKLNERGISFKNMCAEGQTKDGNKFIESFLNLKEKSCNKNGYVIYCFDDNKKDKFNEWYKKFEIYIKNYYNKKIKN